MTYKLQKDCTVLKVNDLGMCIISDALDALFVSATVGDNRKHYTSTEIDKLEGMHYVAQRAIRKIIL